MKLSEVVPWGRSFDEYVDMFALTNDDLARRILGCGDGPASFNAEGTSKGVSITSVDPLYEFDGPAIRKRFEEASTTVIEQVRRTESSWIWDRYSGPDELWAARKRALDLFLEDFQSSHFHQRYVTAALPTLPFADCSFDLAVCSHFLFLYSHILDLNFHLHSMTEMCRISSEVRIFPLLTLENRRSTYVEPIMNHCSKIGLIATCERVDYQFQPGALEMLRVRRPAIA
jgi:hypothetical protein